MGTILHISLPPPAFKEETRDDFKSNKTTLDKHTEKGAQFVFQCDSGQGEIPQKAWSPESQQMLICCKQMFALRSPPWPLSISVWRRREKDGFGRHDN